MIEFEINPDRAYALSLRGIAREAAIAYDVPFHDPAQRDVPAPNDDGYPVRVEAPDGCPVFVDPHGDRLRPDGADPAVDGAARAAGRHAADLAGRRRHQLRDARARATRSTATTPTSWPARSSCAGPPRASRLTTLDDVTPHAVGRGPADHRRLRADRPRRRDGRREHRAVARPPAGGHRGGALRGDRHLPHRAAPQAAHRGRQALGARRRPAAAGVRRRPGRPPARRARRRHDRPTASPTSAAPPEQPIITADVDLPARITGMPIDAATDRGAPAHRRLHGDGRRRRPAADRAAADAGGPT